MKKKGHFNNEKQRWSLRKLSVGLSSVMLGLTFISGANLVQADTTTSANQAEVATESQSSSNTTDESKVSSESSTTSQETTSNNAASSASNTTAAAETASSTKAETTQSSETSESATENKTQDGSAAVSSTSSSSASASSDTAQTTSTQNSSTQANQSSENQQSSASSTTLKVSVSSLKTNSKLAANTLSTSLAAKSTKQTRQWTHYANGWSYKDANGDWVYNQLKKISGKWYYFDNQGYAKTGWYTNDNGSKYYFDKTNANALTGWQTIDSNKYYFDKANAQMYTGWRTVFDTDDDITMYFAESGIWNDVSKVSANSWYKDSDGKFLYNKSNSEVYSDYEYSKVFANDEVLEINGAKYLFDSSSHLVTNHISEVSSEGNKFYANQDGVVQVSKWDKYSDNGKEYWIYSKADGSLANNEILAINGTKYLFNDDGHLVTNDIDYISTDDTSGEYYANQDGIVQVSKWNKLSVDGKEYWVYSQADGTLAQDKVLTINGTKYLFDENENYRLVTNSIVNISTDDGSAEYYANQDGILQVNKWNKYSDNGKEYWIYSKADGTLAQDEVLTINGVKYFFDSNYHMLENAKGKSPSWQKDSQGWFFKDNNGNSLYNQLKKIDNSWYYFNEQGYAKTGWKKVNGSWYYFDPATNQARTGLQKIDNQWYYFDPTTACAERGQTEVAGKWYNFDTENAWAHTGWNESQTSYFDPTTAEAVTGWKRIDGQWYYFDPDNAEKVTGLQEINGKKQYFTSTGVWNELDNVANSSWYKATDGTWLYKKSDGTLASDGVVNISGTNYLFDWYGHLVTNDTLNGYYANKDGIVVTNKWIKTTAYSDESDEQKNQYWIYAGADGSLASDSVVTINGVNYLFNSNRHLVTNDYYELDEGYGTYFANQDGIVQVNKWDKYLDDGTVQWLYSKSDGTLAENEKLTIDGVAYIFDSNYQMVTNSKYSADYLEYYLDANGLIAVNKWNKDTDGSWIYSKADGTLAKSETLTIGNVKYTFDNTGHLIEASTAVKPSWKQTAKGWTYSDEHGNLVTKEWEKIGNNWYYFDEQGIAQTGWQEIDGSWYYFNPTNANAVSGWQKINGSWYYFDPTSSVALTGLQKLSNKLYYFDSDSAKALTGWQELNDAWYYFDPANTYALTGWKKLGNQWYYFSQLDGKMLTGWQKVDGKQQYFNQSGVWQPSATPSSTTGTWKKDSDKNWTFTKSNGQLAKEEILTIDGKRYAFDYHGHLVTNDYYDGYYADQNGEIGFSRWNKDLNGNYTYSQADGSFVYDNIVTINGHKYAFDGQGFMIANGTYSNYYFGADGVAKTNSWILLKDDDSNQNWLYAKADGTLAEQEVLTINGKKYYFDRDNYLATNTKVSDHGNAYYVTTNGQVATNQWISYTTNDDEGTTTHWMYAKADGTLANDEVVSIDGKKYFFDSDNEMRNTTDSDGIYVFNKDGSIVTNRWVSFSDDDNADKYVKADGTYAKNEVLTIDGSKYIFDNDGHLITSTTVTVGSNLYYVNADGVVQDTPNKWISYTDSDSNSKYWLYTKSNGALAIGETVKIGSTKYIFDSNGYLTLSIDSSNHVYDSDSKLITDNAVTIGSNLYYVNTDGVLTTTPNTWITYSYNLKRYYIKSDGTLAHNESLVIENETYHFDTNGMILLSIDENNHVYNYYHNLITNAMVTIDGNYYFVDKSGTLVTTPSTWITYTNDDDEDIQHKLYNKADGTLANEEVVNIDGNDYLFDASGYLVTDRSYTIGNVEYYTNSEGIVISKNNIDDEDEQCFPHRILQKVDSTFLLSPLLRRQRK